MAEHVWPWHHSVSWTGWFLLLPVTVHCRKQPLWECCNMKTKYAVPQWSSELLWSSLGSLLTIWNMHQWQSENSACPSWRNKCTHAPMASQAISLSVKVLYTATCWQKHKYDKHLPFLQSHHPFQITIIILLLETSHNTYHDALDIDHSIDIPITCQ